MLKPFQQWFKDHQEAIFGDFFEFLRFPSISTDPEYKEALISCVKWLEKQVEGFGFETELWETSGHPTLFAENLEAGPKRPTLLIYLHYDVQPAVPLEEWESDPFNPTLKGGKVYARGALDNKGQCFYTLTALKAFHELSRKLKINVKLCIEGEEEVGSTGLQGILEKKKEKLKADYFMVVDVEMLGENQPAVTLGVRGIVTLNVECRNSDADLHSGLFGGFVMNPARALAKALSACWDDEGHVAIPGFYDGVKPLRKDELEAFYMDFDAKAHTSSFHVKVFSGEKGYSFRESNWIRPTFEINGMESGYTGKGFKTIIPSKASVKISCRLIPDQDPEKVMQCVINFLKKKLPEGIEIKVELGHGSKGIIVSPRSHFAKVASKAFEEVFNVPCRAILGGGSLPIVPALAEACGGELVMVGLGLPEDKIHSPNESFGLDRFEKGFLSIVKILQGLEND